MKDPKYTLIQSFVIKNLNSFLDLEQKREKSILEQSNRLLVFQTLLITALYAIIPLIQYKMGEIPLFIWTGTAKITIVILTSLCLNLISQWRFEYRTAALPKSVIAYGRKHQKDFDSEKELSEIAKSGHDNYFCCYRFNFVNVVRVFLLGGCYEREGKNEPKRV